MNEKHGVPSLFVAEAEGWDMIGDFDIQLYHAKLKVGIGPFKAGDTVPVIAFHLYESKPQIEIFTNGEGDESQLFDLVIHAISG